MPVLSGVISSLQCSSRPSSLFCAATVTYITSLYVISLTVQLYNCLCSCLLHWVEKSKKYAYTVFYIVLLFFSLPVVASARVLYFSVWILVTVWGNFLSSWRSSISIWLLSVAPEECMLELVAAHIILIGDHIPYNVRVVSWVTIEKGCRRRGWAEGCSWMILCSTLWDLNLWGPAIGRFYRVCDHLWAMRKDQRLGSESLFRDGRTDSERKVNQPFPLQFLLRFFEKLKAPMSINYLHITSQQKSYTQFVEWEPWELLWSLWNIVSGWTECCCLCVWRGVCLETLGKHLRADLFFWFLKAGSV